MAEDITSVSARQINDPAEPTLTLRDRFAMAALTGMIANAGTRGGADDLADYLAGESYRYADAMMKARQG